MLCGAQVHYLKCTVTILWNWGGKIILNWFTFQRKKGSQSSTVLWFFFITRILPGLFLIPQNITGKTTNRIHTDASTPVYLLQRLLLSNFPWFKLIYDLTDQNIVLQKISFYLTWGEIFIVDPDHVHIDTDKLILQLCLVLIKAKILAKSM